MKICATVNELWAIDEIQNGSRRHLKFIIFVHFVKWSISGGSRLQYCEISFIYVNRRLSYCCFCRKKSKMASTAILDFIFVQYFSIRVFRTSNVIHIPNFVQIRALVNELRAIDEIQNGSRRHLKCIIFVHFVKWSISGGSRLQYCKISFVYVNRRLS